MIPAGFKPNLASPMTKPELLRFPAWGSPKIDGVRCAVFGGVAYSRSLKPIPNPFVQEWAREYASMLEGMDGELVVGSETDPNCMQNTTSGVMSKSGQPDFSFWAFDLVLNGAPFDERSSYLEYRLYDQGGEQDRVRMVSQYQINDLEYLAELEARFLSQGFEGMMLRRSDALYKFGRSTEREGGLLKVKRFVDAEAVVMGFEEEMRNENEATKNALGQTERSTSKAGLAGKGRLGALQVRATEGAYVGVEFNIGTGFTAAQRADFWTTRESLLGRVVTFKYFDHGTVDAPRHPVFKGFRAPEDIT